VACSACFPRNPLHGSLLCLLVQGLTGPFFQRLTGPFFQGLARLLCLLSFHDGCRQRRLTPDALRAPGRQRAGETLSWIRGVQGDVRDDIRGAFMGDGGWDGGDGDAGQGWQPRGGGGRDALRRGSGQGPKGFGSLQEAEVGGLKPDFCTPNSFAGLTSGVFASSCRARL
jgi:hypothetical protein